MLLTLLGGYLLLSYRCSRERGGAPTEAPAGGGGRFALHLFGGLAAVVAGSQLLVPAAGESALRLGVPPDVLAATLVAFGTSLPEMAAALAAVRRGRPGVMVGNVVGANILNCLFVIGGAALVGPVDILPSFYRLHFPAMAWILGSFLFFAALNPAGRFRRWQGGWVLAGYVLYLFIQYAVPSLPTVRLGLAGFFGW